MAWLAQVWGAISGQLAPPLSAAVLLAGEHRGWPVEAALLPLWTRLRLTTLWHLWRASQPGALDAGAQPLTAVRVASSILHDCRGAIQRDFTRVSSLIDCGWACQWPGCAGARPRWSSRSFRPAGATARSSAVQRQTAFWSCAGQPRTPCPSPLRALAKLRAAAGALPAAGAKAAAAAGRRH